MEAAIITSLQNRYVKFVRSLAHRKYREREQRFLIEGIRAVQEALEQGAPVESLVLCPELMARYDRARIFDVLDEHQALRRIPVSEYVFRRVSDREEPHGIAAVVRQWTSDLGDIRLDDEALLLVVEEIRDPGNLGTILRTSDALGASGIVLLGRCVDMYDPKVVRATMGSLFALPIVRVSEGEAFVGWARRERIRIVASCPEADRSCYEVDYRGRVAILVGNEAKGLTEETLDCANETVRIPMPGRADSLNVACAAAILLYEAARERGGGARGQGGKGEKLCC